MIICHHSAAGEWPSMLVRRFRSRACSSLQITLYSTFRPVAKAAAAADCSPTPKSAHFTPLNAQVTREWKQKEGKPVRTENAKKRAQRLLKRGLLLSQSCAVPDELKRLGILSLVTLALVRSQRAESVLPKVLYPPFVPEVSGSSGGCDVQALAVVTARRVTVRGAESGAMGRLRCERVVARLLLMFSPLEGDRAGHAR